MSHLTPVNTMSYNSKVLATIIQCILVGEIFLKSLMNQLLFMKTLPLKYLLKVLIKMVLFNISNT